MVCCYRAGPLTLIFVLHCLTAIILQMLMCRLWQSLSNVRTAHCLFKILQQTGEAQQTISTQMRARSALLCSKKLRTLLTACCPEGPQLEIEEEIPLEATPLEVPLGQGQLQAWRRTTRTRPTLTTHSTTRSNSDMCLSSTRSLGSVTCCALAQCS